MIEKEYWIKIKDFETYYEISNYGRVKRLPRKTNNRWGEMVLKERILSTRGTNKHGYITYVLYKNGGKFCFSAHKLVALHFLDKPPKFKNQVNHIDSNKTNNFYKNLEWVTQSENIQHAYDNVPSTRKFGKDAKHFKGEVYVFDKFGNQVDILVGTKDMKEKGYEFRNVFACIYGTRKTHKGMTFKRNENNQ